MLRGNKLKSNDEQECKADRAAEGDEKRGVSDRETERTPGATVNEDDGGDRKAGGPDCNKLTHRPAAHKGGENGGGIVTPRSVVNRSASVNKAAVARKRNAEAFRVISNFAAQKNVAAAGGAAIGAFESATVGRSGFLFRSYRMIPVAAQCEVLNAIGDIAGGDDGMPSLYLHGGLSDNLTRGGYLLSGILGPTPEVMVAGTWALRRRKKKAGLRIALTNL